jgi:hypothetical protein
LQYWVLNSGHHTCYAGILPLEPLCQPLNLLDAISLPASSPT